MTTGSQQPADPAARLQFDDPLSLRSADDTDSGWGEVRAGEGGSAGAASGGGQQPDGAADLARFLEEKPPHHL
ncbi:hypothetical protein DB35_25555 [Streptomyces abyssalis]|uniref:Uncharacterized protein n=1 Tax=Streptomyces abyssalis TaxID=933944 RepID=A0A1E7JN00_9ACTN|nr:hypothetical protein [Streptomyces abyssalis]OEU86953.1 hypothetical protein DB35_25555 [Streptomyces abyssalis]OEU89662.1 hypothetical protein AN215_08010 [Streptomyces abyssalis]OEV07164.1 hypothetical protein AN219_32660 [Streptomyces nanshensis]